MNGGNLGNVKVNLADAPDVVCDQCGDRRFEPVHLMKRLSKLMSPTGESMLIPIGPSTGFMTMWACYKCGHINEEFLPLSLKATTPAAEEKKDGIISSHLPTIKTPIKLVTDEE